MNETEFNKTSYLHEAGHAIVAIECGLVVHEVVCDGEVGHCHATLPPEKSAIFEQVFHDADPERITNDEFLSGGIAANRGMLTSLLGGIAGESLAPTGTPITSTRRASDDISTFFAYLRSITRKLNAARFAPIWQSTFEDAQDSAWEIVRRREVDLRKIAEALEAKGTLFGGDVERILGLEEP